MNSEKQIEEMALDIHKEGSFGLELSATLAEGLTEKGCRKASEVVRKIFEEIEEGVKAAVSALQFENNPIHRKVKHETYSSLMRFVKSVEKKYTESEGEG